MIDDFDARMRALVRHVASDSASHHLRTQIAAIPANEPPPAIARPRPGRLLGALAAAGLVVAVTFVGLVVLTPPRSQNGQGGPSPSASAKAPASGLPLPAAAQLLASFSQLPDLMAAANGSMFGIEISQTAPDATVFKIATDGSVTRRPLSDPIAYYFSALSVGGNSIYLATDVVRRLSNSSDEILRLDASTLEVVARATLPSGAVGLVTTTDGVWVALADRVLRLDPATLKVQATHVFEGFASPPGGTGTLTSIATGPGGIWVSANVAAGDTLDALDPVTLQPSVHVDLGASQGSALAGDATWLWLTSADSVRLVSDDGTLGAPVVTIGLQGAAAHGDRVLVLVIGNTAETLVDIGAPGRIDASSGVGDAGGKIATDGSLVWLLNGTKVEKWELKTP